MLKKLFEFTPAIALTALLVGLGSFVLWSSNYLDSKDDMLGAVLTPDMTGSTSLAVLNAKFDSIDALTNTIPGDTDDLSEGSTNLYYTLDRVNSRIYAVVGATTSLPNLNITESQISDLGDYIELTDLSCTATGLTYTNTTGVFSLSAGYAIPQTTSINNWNTAYGWGNHADGGYLTSYTETDTVWMAASSSYLTVATAGDTYLTKASYFATSSLPGTATTTAVNGIDISTGCFAVNGTCISGGGGSGEGTVNAGTAGQIAYYLADGTAVSGTSTINISANGSIVLNNSTKSGSDIWLFANDEVWFDAGTTMELSSGGDMSFYTTAGNKHILLSNNSCATCFIGIGTSTPAYKLDVYGNARIDGNITANNLNISAWDAKWSFASTTLDYWFDNTAGITRLNSYLTQAYASSTFYTKLEIDAFGYISQSYASSTFLTITDAQSSYDVKGQATSTLSSHTSTYNHANYDTAYGWGNHASAGYLGQSAYYATTTHGTITDLPVLNTYPAFSIASSTWMSIAGLTASSTIQLKPAYTAETWAGIRCATDAGTALVKVGDGSNWMTTITASTTAGLIAVSSNNTFTAGEVIKAVVSNITATTNWISCSVSKKNQ